MAKVDIKAAYRHIPIDPYDWDKLAFRWPTDNDADMYLDGYLQFGMMNACEVFNRVGRALVRMMMRRGHKCIVVYVDDFIMVCENQAMAWYVYWTLRLLLRKLGFQVNPKPHKCIPPCQALEFLGIELDSVSMKARLSESKLHATLALVRPALSSSSITRRNLDKLNGKLNWVCKVVYGGRTFVRRLIDTQWSVARPHHHIRISSSVRLDLQWWLDFLPQFHGQTELIPSRPSSLFDFSTDASSSYGYGAFILGGYFSLTFVQAAALFEDAPVQSAPIHIHELYVVLIVCCLYSAALPGQHLRIYFDKTIVVSAVNTGTAKGQTGAEMMGYLREIGYRLSIISGLPANIFPRSLTLWLMLYLVGTL
jgi:hypothetical protein